MGKFAVAVALYVLLAACAAGPPGEAAAGQSFDKRSGEGSAPELLSKAPAAPGADDAQPPAGPGTGAAAPAPVPASVGVFAAALIGSPIEAELDAADRAAAEQAAQKTFALAPAGQPVAWRNPGSGHSGSFTAGRVSLRSDGRYCRDFQQWTAVAGRTHQAQGTACRQPDGTWRMAR